MLTFPPGFVPCTWIPDGIENFVFQAGTYKYTVTATATESGATATAEVSFEVMQSDEKKEPAVSYTPLEKPEPELTEKVNKKLSELIDG